MISSAVRPRVAPTSTAARLSPPARAMGFERHREGPLGEVQGQDRAALELEVAADAAGEILDGRALERPARELDTRLAGGIRGQQQNRREALGVEEPKGLDARAVLVRDHGLGRVGRGVGREVLLQAGERVDVGGGQRPPLGERGNQRGPRVIRDCPEDGVGRRSLSADGCDHPDPLHRLGDGCAIRAQDERVDVRREILGRFRGERLIGIERHFSLRRAGAEDGREALDGIDHALGLRAGGQREHQTRRGPQGGEPRDGFVDRGVPKRPRATPGTRSASCSNRPAAPRPAGRFRGPWSRPDRSRRAAPPPDAAARRQRAPRNSRPKEERPRESGRSERVASSSGTARSPNLFPPGSGLSTATARLPAAGPSPWWPPVRRRASRFPEPRPRRRSPATCAASSRSRRRDRDFP